MTITEPARAGLAWDDEDHETLVRLAKDRADLATMAAAVQRGESATWQRLRLLLPIEHRKCPRDRILPALYDAVLQSDYDWRRVVLQSPPPPPVTRIVRSGLAGLDDDDLVQVTQAVALLDSPPTAALLANLAGLIGQRGLREHFAAVHSDFLHRRGLTGRTRRDLHHAAAAWLDSLIDQPGPSGWDGYPDDYHVSSRYDGLFGDGEVFPFRSRGPGE